ncbi:hypothetical protein ACOI1H_14655 [Loktanella sp. DJP18]|uniref:hypothetical protein n=1 Tax=Loktanella sp. DJP18 TaxID=3409788 RepID=UPI003BB75350
MKPFALPTWMTVVPDVGPHGDIQFALSALRSRAADVTAAIDLALAYERKHMAEAEGCLAQENHEDAALAASMLFWTNHHISSLETLRTRLCDVADDGVIEMSHDMQSRIVRNLP